MIAQSNRAALCSLFREMAAFFSFLSSRFLIKLTYSFKKIKKTFLLPLSSSGVRDRGFDKSDSPKIIMVIFEKNNGVDENLVVTFHLDIFCHLGVYSHLALMAAFE